MVGWDEILHKDMPTDIVIQSWRGKESMEKAARQGYKSILSNGYYIDLMYPARDHYLNDPLPADIDLNEAQKKLVLGGEATMWSELVSIETIDSRIWPRTAAIAERFWSPQDINDVSDMYRRLQTISFQLEEHGLTHIKNQAMMLRRLTRNQDIRPLKILVDVIEPLKRYQRHRKRPLTSYSPLTRVVDAAIPDAPAALEFNKQVETFLENDKYNPENAAALKKWLVLWKDNHTKLKPIIDGSPILKEIEPLSIDLSAIAGIGLEAIIFIEKKEPPAAQWLKENLKLLKLAEKSAGQTTLMIVPAIRKLVQRSEM
jgi:hexosaminidase